MMQIESYRGPYQVIKTNNFDFISEISKEDYIFSIIDKKILELYPDELRPLIEKNHFVVEAIETNKTLDTSMEIINELVQMESKKNTVVVAVGGGIIQDISCFVSTVLYRGIKWYLIPTTLLAQTDSCIGSKSSINYKEFKNLLGSFYPPKRIFICTDFLKTLTDKDYKSGLGEIAKCMLMSSKENFTEFCTDLPEILKRDYNLVMKHMSRTLSFKKGIIEQDEFDTGIRNIMNYGHTFGHAIESSTKYAIPHGQAVSIGVLIANTISVKRGMIKDDYANFILRNIRSIISNDFFGNHLIDPDSVIKNMKMDKKYTGKHNCILLSETGANIIKGVSETEIAEAIQSIVDEMGF